MYLKPAQAALLLLLQSAIAYADSLSIDTSAPLEMLVYRDDYQFSASSTHLANRLPEFDFSYTRHEDKLIPHQRGAQRNDHPLWEFILAEGSIAADAQGVERVILPFALQERNANCTHNGVLRFLLPATLSEMSIEVDISSETCMYFQFDMSGKLTGSYSLGSIADKKLAVKTYDLRRHRQMPVSSFKELKKRHPEIDTDAFAGVGKLPPEHISLFGLVIDEVHYRSDCPVRSGLDFPCEQLALPSYSLAKSLVAGLAAMRLEKLFPGSMQREIEELVPECRGNNNWKKVTLLHALNMLTGNFGRADGRHDEWSAINDKNFFLKESHQEKINYSCVAWPRRAAPGTTWVYHTTDTYIVGTAINAILRERLGSNSDLYRDLVLPLWENLKLNPALSNPGRTYDEVQQPFTGYGLTMSPDDIARLGQALNRGEFASLLDESMYNSAMQRHDQPQGTYPVDNEFYYQHGFWAYDAQEILNCNVPVTIPFMSGYGGINLVMMPNDTVYYVFGDSGKFSFKQAVIESHKLRDMCNSTNKSTERIR